MAIRIKASAKFIMIINEWTFQEDILQKSSEVMQICMPMFNCFPVHKCVAKRRHKFLVNYITSDNILCCMCQNSGARELNMLHQP